MRWLILWVTLSVCGCATLTNAELDEANADYAHVSHLWPDATMIAVNAIDEPGNIARLVTAVLGYPYWQSNDIRHRFIFSKSGNLSERTWPILPP